MSHDTRDEERRLPGDEEDCLTAVLRKGSQKLIREAVMTELEDFLAAYQERKDARGRRALVRNGYLPEREVLMGIGPVKVQVPKVRDRSVSGIKFTTKLVPPYLRRAPRMEEVLPWLYLKGVSTGDFQEALEALVGPEAKGLSPVTIGRLKAKWEQEHAVWRRRDLSEAHYVYWWADGVYFNVRGDEARQCILVLIGVTAEGTKEFVAIEDGYRESEQSWWELLIRLKCRGLQVAPKLAVGDGALGFWAAVTKVYGETKHQCCWVHKTANVLKKVPKGMQAKMKAALHEIWIAPTRAQAYQAFDTFVASYGAKYPKAVECLEKDREALLAFYEFPPEHWQHLRTTNPIESTFATVRLRTDKTRECVSRQTILALVFRLELSAQKDWRKLRGFKRLGAVIRGVQFCDEVAVTDEHGHPIGETASGIAA